MFWDQVEIDVAGGSGGPGMVSFRRERFVPRGGPDGGDGGKGGDVVLVADRSVTAFLALRGKTRQLAADGRPGGPRLRSGRSGEDLLVHVPVGTLVREARHGNLLKDLDRDGARVVVARGGAGGRGNARFASATRRVPRHAQPGLAGEKRTLLLDLKLIAEVGLVGLPNAGKSTLIARLSALRPKVADYPFTTLEPALGIVAISPLRTLTFADLPGLIEGAHQGCGLGDRFLRHVERTRVLLHLVDVGPSALLEPIQACRIIAEELRLSSCDLGSKPRLVVATKVEDEESEGRALELARVLGQPVLAISSATGRGLDELKGCVTALVDRELERGSSGSSPGEARRGD